MQYVCLDCGREFDTPAHWEESRGEYWGVPFGHGNFEENEEENEDEDEENE